MLNVALAVPHGDCITMQFYHSILIMQGATHQVMPEVQFCYSEIECHMVSLARNKIVTGALQIPADYVFWIDDDVLVPPNAFLDLYAHQKGIVSGLYFTRLYPHTPQMYQWSGEKKGYTPILGWDGTLTKVDAVGSGCILVKAEVYHRLAQLPIAYARDVPLSNWYEFLNGRGEDFYFCERARDAGYDIWVDPAVQCEHLSMQKVGVEDYKKVVASGKAFTLVEMEE